MSNWRYHDRAARVLVIRDRPEARVIPRKAALDFYRFILGAVP